MNESDLLNRCRRLTDPGLREAVDTLPGSLRHVAGYHFGWWDKQGRAEEGNSGRALRPALALLAAEAVGGTATAAIPAAAAVELVHNFSLLHDDVMDGDATRRHRPTAWTVFGVGAAILAGDALLNLAFDVLAQSGRHAETASTMLNETVNQLLEGQADDLGFEDRDVVPLAECVLMAQRKTGALLECSVTLGALYGGGSQAQREQLRAFAAELGLSIAYQRQQPSDEDELSLARMAGRIDKAGGRRWCDDQARLRLERALSQLDTPATPVAARQLTELARLITNRDR